MSDLISRQEAIDADAIISDLEYDVELDPRAPDDTGLVGLYHDLKLFDKVIKAKIIAYLKEAPTVDVVPVRHGKWIIRDNPGTGWYRVTCSECGEDVTATAPCIGFFPNAKVNWNYCPECGARMDEERKEE